MKNPVITIAKYTFLEAINNSLFRLLVIGVVCIFVLGQFIGNLAVTESYQMQGAIIGFVLRLACVFIISLFVISCVVREINDKTIDIILSLDLPRHVYFAGKICGFYVLSLVVSLLFCIPLLFYSEINQVYFWAISLICELFIVVSLCLLFLFTMGNIITAFTAVAAFYLLARIISTLQLISHSPILDSGNWSQNFMTGFIDFMATILPHFDKFTQTEWLVYGSGTSSAIAYVVIQTLIYVILLSAAALFDLYRKNF